ncbi:MAG: nucleotidyltransferase family protein [Rhodoferax sp.]
MNPATVSAMVLAAGRGERMRPLTDHCPKPLLRVRGKPLLGWHLHALAAAGVHHAVVNTAWLGQQIVQEFGNKICRQPNIEEQDTLLNSYHMPLHYSHESQDFGGALETLGGICRALPLLQAGQSSDPVFWLVAGDVFMPDFEFAPAHVARFVRSSALAHLWLVPNPAHNPRGDFGLQVRAQGQAALALNLPADDPRPRLTYATLGLFRAALFAPPWCDIAPGNPKGVRAPLAPLLRRAMDHGRITAEVYDGAWTDVGTPERLAELNANASRCPAHDAGCGPAPTPLDQAPGAWAAARRTIPR